MTQRLNNVVSINCHSSRFPVGSYAFHHRFGVCKIIHSDQVTRTVRWIDIQDNDIYRQPIDFVESPNQVIKEEVITLFEECIDANELSPLQEHTLLVDQFKKNTLTFL